MSLSREKEGNPQQVETVGTTASLKSSENDIDGKYGAADVVEARELVAGWTEGTLEEKRLVRKLDWRILPCTWVLYLLGYLDRANVGYAMNFDCTMESILITSRNAKTGGLEDDFGLSSSQYSIIVLVFFLSYLVFEVPANMILTRVRPSLFLPGLGLVWGTFAALMGATQNWSQLAGMRFLLGFAEVCEVERRSRTLLTQSFQAGFAPGCAFFLSSWYRKYELATRYAILYTSVPIAGAVSGLLAGVITDHMDGVSGLPGWRWLFVSLNSTHLREEDCLLGCLTLLFVTY